jgi:hypothetical protein
MPQQIQVQVGNEEVMGHYSNLVQVHAGPEEICLDFFSLFPPVGGLVARIVMSPGHLKRMVRVLQNALVQYEQQHGNVEEAKELEKPQIGFRQS